MPLKNTAYRVYFPILDADGDLVTGAAGLDSEISKDGGTFADCTSEATEIATSSGMYYLELTSTEMNADAVCVIVKTSTSGAKTTPIVLYPVEGGDIDVDVTYIAGSAVSASTAQLGVNVVQAAGTAWGSGAITAASIATGAIDADAIADNAIDAGSIATGAITAAKFAAGAIDAAAIAADAIGASELAADAASEIGTAVWATATRVLTAPTNITSTDGEIPITAGGLVSADVTAISTDTTAANNAESFFDGTGYAGTNNVIPAVTTVNGFAAGAITAAAIATGAVDADALAADAVDEILDEAVEGSLTLRQALRVILAAVAGESTGGGTSTITFRDQADTKARIEATIDANRNRTAVTVDGS